MKSIARLSLFLGSIMLAFGILKFIPPFKTWYTLQIETSELGNSAYWLGISGEIIAGTLLIIGSRNIRSTRSGLFIQIIAGASIALIVMMLTGIYVHLHPAVPAAVLPLKIKPPYIPVFFMLLAFLNTFLALRLWYRSRK